MISVLFLSPNLCIFKPYKFLKVKKQDMYYIRRSEAGIVYYCLKRCICAAVLRLTNRFDIINLK